MIRTLPATLALTLALALAPSPPALGQGLPLPGIGGGQLRAADLERGEVLVVFWASWSPRCRDIVERVAALKRRWGGRARVITVSFQEDEGAIRRFLEGAPMPAPVYVDESGAFSKRHSVTTLPALLVYQEGEEVFSGRLPEDADGAIGRALGGR